MDRGQTKPTSADDRDETVFADHTRRWEHFTYVYPVVSRRSRGLSIGINLNADTICNFDCVYCQVDKAEHPRPKPVDMIQLEAELTELLTAVGSGALWAHPRFNEVSPTLRRLNDIAFSGDGEPTSSARFPDAVELVIRLKQSLGLQSTKIILITNATLLDRPHVASAIDSMVKHLGEVWAKLDAGTEAYYKRVDRSHVPYRTVLNNLLVCGRRRPIVIQTMLAKLHEVPFPEDEFGAYTQRLSDLIAQGCQIKAVQLYTVARPPLEPYVTALPTDALSRFADRLRAALPDTPVECFGAEG